MKAFDSLEISREEMYSEINLDHRSLLTEDGEIIFFPGYEMGLGLIEQYVEDLAMTDDSILVLNEWEAGKTVSSPTNFARRKMSIFGLLSSSYSEMYEYSVTVNIFYETCLEMSLQPDTFKKKKTFYKNSYYGPNELFFEFVKVIKEKYHSQEFKRKKLSRETNAKRNYLSAIKYMDGIFSIYSRIVVLRIDFGYLEKFADEISLCTANENRKKFLNNIRTNVLFENMVGYVWKLEYGENKGYHFHFILIFDGAKVRKDEYLAERIGKYWASTITRGIGMYYSCNRNKSKYKYCGIGVINHFEADKRLALKTAIKYLTKKDQYLRVRSKKIIRVFGKGELPQPRRAGAGRPRRNHLCV